LVRIGFTGTRYGMSDKQKLAVKQLFDYTTVEEFHHGDCVGADEEAVLIAGRPNIVIHSHPPKAKRLRAYAGGHVVHPEKNYADRNHDIVNQCDFLIACPEEMTEQPRGSTWSIVRYARRVGRAHTVIFPDGTELPWSPPPGAGAGKG
jgi:hypothetical protein